MSTTTEGVEHQVDYALQRTPLEYERLRAQALVWEPATVRVLDRIDLAPGATCLDAGCGPGETMRLLARRVGPDGAVTGIDVDAALGTLAETALHESGHRQCRVRAVELTGDAPVPGAPYDLVFARLLLFHLPQRVPVLSRLWDAVAPGGHLVVQDYDLHALDVVPSLASVDEVVRVVVDTFGALGCDIRAGARLPGMFAQAGAGEPDGTDVTGRVEPLAKGHRILEQTFRSVLPAAIAHDVTDPKHADAVLAALRRDAARLPDTSMVWPLMVGAWKQKRRGSQLANS
ncbi:class I SAM-dependent methyltransferase [Geodermatophilus maliterrae]|uniref:Trans-aconitate 2-methyltransferase n=1 Tax=Geodermatophilus maliterrae TaxID=3162531 RepID=A0ABV3XEK2_9ACTN